MIFLKFSTVKYIFLMLVIFFLAPSITSAAERFESPLRFRTIEEFVGGALQAFVYIALPVVAFFVVFSGFKFIAAQGNEADLTKAKENFKHVIIGSALVLGAWALAVLIKGTVDQLRGES
jgi:hypothetical protein